MIERPDYPRFLEPRLMEALADTPVVLVHGPRQCGKTTLARAIGEAHGYDYINFDDGVALAAAEADPMGFVRELPEKIILDEIQKAPGILAPIKMAVDRNRTAGRFLLTGSANALLVPRLAEALVGRIEILRLHPLAQCEIAGRKSRFLDALFAGRFSTGSYEALQAALAERVEGGGYPSALARSTSRRRQAWYRDYLDTLVQRDIRDLARISALDSLPRLVSMAAGQTARLLNLTDLAGPFSVSRQTIRDYVTLLERVFVLEELPPWHSNRLSRLVKSPKVHLCDTGVACAVLNLDARALMKDRSTFGQLLETFVFQELRRQASWHESQIRFHHFRDRDGVEVDIVLDRGAAGVAGVEVKASATVTLKDFRGLRKLKAATGPRFACGAVLYDGELAASFGEGLYAVPLRALWEA